MEVTDAQLGAWADEHRLFARTCERDGAPTYQRICEGIAQDRQLLELWAGVAAEQRRPNLLLAAVHYLLLSGIDHPLAAWYPTVRPGPATPGDPVPAFCDFCREHRTEIEGLMATRATQTNEIGRCAVLLPALAAVGASTGGPLALVDLGASAGLNLLFDHYAYDYLDRRSQPVGAGARVGAGGEVPTISAGDRASPVRLTAELRHGSLPALGVPPAPYRIGLDHRPVDPTDPDQARWLLACQWPDHLERFARLRAALTLAQGLDERPPVVTGDMVEDLAAVSLAAPAGAALCIYHTWAAAYLSVDRQRELVEAVQEVAEERPVRWLFVENPHDVPSLPVPPPPGPAKVGGPTALVLVEIDEGAMRVRRLADVHFHGRWLHWW